jgi:hypothetical protein
MKIRSSILGHPTTRKLKQPANHSRAEPLIVTHYGEERTVKFGDFLYYVTTSADADPQDVAVRKVRVLLATAKRLTTQSAAGLQNTTWDSRGANKLSPQHMLVTLFALDEDTAIRRHQKAVELEIQSVGRRLQQLQHNRAWCEQRLGEIGNGAAI